jgi:peptidoglycan hydrolase CwlO-like protein
MRALKILFLKFCCVVCVWLVLNSILTGYATTSASVDTLRQQQQQINQERQNVIQQRDRLSNLQNAAQNRLTGINQNINTTNNQIQDSESRLVQATQRLQKLEADLVVAQRTYEERQIATVARLRYLQRSHVNQGWAVLMQSQNISDFISRRHQLKLVYRADQKILAKLNTQAIQINQQKTDVEQQKNEIALIRQQLLGQKADYQAQAQSQSELIQRLNSDRQALEAAENQLERDSQNLENLIQEKVAALEGKSNSRTSIIIRGTGMFAYPSNAPTSSRFGWRVHPVLGYRRFHAGLDFSASYCSTISAAD